ncbi:MAG: sulfur carrier protein ThiS [Nitrosomonadales bacterium]|mgnify:CR=1 FL=1|jgi:sulfur carrier protein|nr:sulfur carrier protein ThiS [Nitrosomonadales bacterium]MBT4571211.1 sulfur carrier protein ThiS [Nitrosomonadales bacterium]MBT4758847.1 sulfur carrier protein ThiS [Nitrosomonadales bacterium]MBT5149866.1 sulfur carrier protein ThiS [Nitrosomonadales bacterium]MBT6250466.1 sulfur carrier protein ThiS [Nitrosomonadales bacterium]
MKIHVNGLQKYFEVEQISLSKLIEELALTEKKFAIEYNGEIISKGNFTQTLIKDGDKLEIVVAVGGG